MVTIGMAPTIGILNLGYFRTKYQLLKFLLKEISLKKINYMIFIVKEIDY